MRVGGGAVTSELECIISSCCFCHVSSSRGEGREWETQAVGTLFTQRNILAEDGESHGDLRQRERRAAATATPHVTD